jgi:hypothetical protein
MATAILPLGNLALRPGEAQRRFANAFHIEQVAAQTGLASWPRGWATYLMTRH